MGLKPLVAGMSQSSAGGSGSSSASRQLLRNNRRTMLNLAPEITGTLATGSGGIVDQNGNIAFCNTGGTAASRCGIIWDKGISYVYPGGQYHYLSWMRGGSVTFHFGFFTNLTTGTGLIAYLGNDGTQLATALTWVPSFSGLGIKVLADGSLAVYIDNLTANTHSVHVTPAVLDVTGNAECVHHEVTLDWDGLGNVSVYVDGGLTPVETYSGMEINQIPNNDVYPQMMLFNEPTGTATNLNFGVFPMDIILS